MKISRIAALFLLVFRPRKLIERTNADYKEMNTPGAIQQKQERNQSTSQAERSINQIRSSLFWSFVLVAGAVLVASVIGKVYFALGGAHCQTAEEILQYSGIGVLLWATLGKAGWSIQTTNGDTIPELVNELVFRALYVLGSFLLALAVSLAFGASNT
ncbi:MAG TPA: hypothetical protein PL023_09830 [Thiobacillus sp.]|nr:hypothetical protein [Thiobacillus sp.]